jgi:mono/diheme cytochrome c family protein
MEQLSCLGCHRLKGEGGRVGPDLTTVRDRRSPDYIAAIVADPQGTAPGSAMPKVPMPEATRALVTRYLATQAGSAPSNAPSKAAASPAGVPATQAASSATSPANGAQLYARWCASCHGTEGKGNGPNAPFLPVKPANHSDAAMESQRPDDSLYDTIAGGGGIMNRSPRMPAFGATLSPTEIRALVAHIRSLCHCQGPGWSRDGAKAP